MLNPLPDWKAELESLAPVDSVVDGTLNFATAIKTQTEFVQAGATGSVGILTFNHATFASEMSSNLSITSGTEWADKMALAWMNALTASVITPGTVASPVWTASGVDVVTLPTGGATITTLSAAYNTLKSGLLVCANLFQGNDTEAQKTAPEKVAKAFRDATLELQFNCIGLVAAVPSPIPTPIVFSAL